MFTKPNLRCIVCGDLIVLDCIYTNTSTCARQLLRVLVIGLYIAHRGSYALRYVWLRLFQTLLRHIASVSRVLSIYRLLYLLVITTLYCVFRVSRVCRCLSGDSEQWSLPNVDT